MALLVKAGGGENVTPQVETYENLLETAIANLAGKAFKPMQSKTVTPTAAGFTVIPDEGHSLEEVIINGDADLIAENIRQGIDIFGVLGTMSEGLTPAMFGCTKMAVDEFTFSSNTSGSVELSHTLGIVPKFAIVFAKTLPSIYANAIARASVVINANNHVCYWSIAIKNGSDWSLGSGDSGSATTTKLSGISSSRIYQGGIKYGLITFG